MTQAEIRAMMKLPIEYMWTANTQQAAPRKLYFTDVIKAGSSWEHRVPLTKENIYYYLKYCVDNDQMKSAIRILDYELYLDTERRKEKVTEMLRDDLWIWIVESNLLFQWAFAPSKYEIDDDKNLYYNPRERILLFMEYTLVYIMREDVYKDSNRLSTMIRQIMSLSKIAKSYLHPLVESIQNTTAKRNGILLSILCALHNKEAEIENEILLSHLNDPVFMFHDPGSYDFDNLGRVMLKLGDNKKVVLDLLFGNLLYFHLAYIEAIKSEAVKSGWNLNLKENKITPVIKITSENLYKWAKEYEKKVYSDEITVDLKCWDNGLTRLRGISEKINNIVKFIEKNYLSKEFNLDN